MKPSTCKRMFKPGERVLVYDCSQFKDDYTTPCLQLELPATVVCWYGEKTNWGTYPDLVDVVFDHRPEYISHGHFGDGVEKLEYLLDPEWNIRYKPEYLPLLIEKAKESL
jgi:hypothetical protein